MLISDGIEKVRAFEIPCGIWVDGGYIGAPKVALVKWRSSHSDKLHQIYVNGRFAGVTVDSRQRQEIVRIPASFETPVRIEVFAVEARYAHFNFSRELEVPFIGSGRVKITLLRGQNLPIGATADIFFDNATGQIDYENPINYEPIQTWPAWQDKTGFAMAGFGIGDFGYDGAAAVGFAKGSFGYGQFGFDADVIDWISRPLPDGIYKFAIKITDCFGRESISETGQITVIPAAKPAEHLNIASLNKQTNQMILKIT